MVLLPVTLVRQVLPVWLDGLLISAIPGEGFIPAHRVVNRNGLLSGKHHFGTPGAMQQLLENENVKVEDNKVVNFNELFWDPCKEI
jgi:alkylated DNA nucleotide flippase Atl1